MPEHPTVRIRRFKFEDTGVTAQIFFEAVRQGTAEFYNAEQRAAWAVDVPELASWRERLLSQISFVAENEQEICGLMTLDASGYVDLAFVSPDHIGQGVGGKLYDEIERTAMDLGIDHLTTEASLMAQGFFAHYGWQIVAEQTIFRHGIALNNIKMRKHIGSR